MSEATCTLCGKPASVALDVFDREGNPTTIYLCRDHWRGLVRRLEEEARRENEVLAIVYDGERIRLKRAAKPRPVRVPTGPSL